MQWISTMFQTMARPLKWWVVVASWEQGLRVRLGKRTARLDPGIHFRFPFLDRIYVQSTRLRVTQAQSQSISTKNGDTITFGLAVKYQIEDIVVMYQAAACVDQVLLYEAVSRAAHLIAAVETHDGVTAAKLEQKVGKDMPSTKYGLCDVEVSVLNFCRARCYRLISGDGWIHSGKSLDNIENSGEIK